MSNKSHFWTHFFRRNRFQAVKTTPRQSQTIATEPAIKQMLMVMVSEEDCAGQSQAIKQLEQQGAELAITNQTNPTLRLNALSAFVRVGELNRSKGGEIFKRIVYVEKSAKYRDKAAKRSSMVMAVGSLEEAVKALDSLSFF